MVEDVIVEIGSQLGQYGYMVSWNNLSQISASVHDAFCEHVGDIMIWSKDSSYMRDGISYGVRNKLYSLANRNHPDKVLVWHPSIIRSKRECAEIAEIIRVITNRGC